jgi:hypothetical protein
MTDRLTANANCFAAAWAVCLMAFSAFSAYVEPGRGIISQPVLFFVDGTLITGANGNDSLTDVDGDGLYEVLPGDEITLPGQTVTNVVPRLPGYPDGTPYEFDPTVPAIIGGAPQVVVDLDGSLVPGTPIVFPGYDEIAGNGNDILVDPDDPAVFLDSDNGYVVVTNAGAVIEHRDGTPLDGGAVPAGSVIAAPASVVCPGSGTEQPADHINSDDTIHLVAGNTVDLDGDGRPPWEAPEPGTYDPATGMFYPDSSPDAPYLVPPVDLSIDGDPIIERISLGTVSIYLDWPNHPSSGIYLSEIQAKVSLTDTTAWETLQHNVRGVTVTETNAVIPRALQGTETGVTPGVYRFFKRVVPNHQP